MAGLLLLVVIVVGVVVVGAIAGLVAATRLGQIRQDLGSLTSSYHQLRTEIAELKRRSGEQATSTDEASAASVAASPPSPPAVAKAETTAPTLREPLAYEEQLAAITDPAAAPSDGATKQEEPVELAEECTEAVDLVDDGEMVAAGESGDARWQMIPPETVGKVKVSLEQRIGGYWLLIAGVIAVLFGVGFFLKYAYDNNLISPLGRVLIAAGAGAAAIIVGEWTRRRDYGFVAKGLTALGFAILYAAVFAAYNLYDLIGVKAAFGLSILITIIAMAYAVGVNEVVAAFLALLGGYLSPILLSTGENRPMILFTYVALLSIGAMLCAVFRKWRAINLYRYCQNAASAANRARGDFLGQMYVSVLWAVYAAVLTAVGFWRQRAALRYMALGLFAILLVKVFLLDMSHLPSGYRIAGLVVAGVVLVGVSYLYQYARKNDFFEPFKARSE